MALSNWFSASLNFDIVARGPHKEETYSGACSPGNGEFTVPDSDLSIAVYKNWAYVRSPSMWQEDGSYINSTIAQINSGDLCIHKLEVKAVRGRQQSIILAAYVNLWGYDAPEEKKGYYSRLQGIIGVGGYGYNDSEWVGLEHQTLEEVKRVLPDLFENASVQVDKAIDLDKLLQFNQGDAYFADQLGAETPMQVIGDPQEPLLTTIIQGMKAHD